MASGTQHNKDSDTGNSRYWRRWYWALIIWLAVLIALFTWFTKYWQ